MKRIDVFTTGQIARMLATASRTVGKWFDAGKLRGYRTPGSEHRRVPRAELIRFLRDNDMPLPEELNGAAAGHPQLLLVSHNPIGKHLAAVLPGWRVKAVPTLFDLGMALGQGSAPDVLLFDLYVGRHDCLLCAAQARELYLGCPVVILACEDEPDLVGLRSRGLHIWQRPVDWNVLAAALDTLAQGESRAVPRSTKYKSSPPGPMKAPAGTTTNGADHEAFRPDGVE